MFVQEQFVALLLQRANIQQTVRDIQPITNRGITNQIALITLQDGLRLIVRRH